MISKNITPSELFNNSRYELIETVSYDELKPFILRTIQKKSRLITFYSVLQIIALTALAALVVFFIFRSVSARSIDEALIGLGASLIFSFTLLIPLHEAIHALAFLLAGKRSIGFGADLKKFIFYAEAHRQVVNQGEMTFVALAPLFTIALVSILPGIYFWNTPAVWFFAGIFLLHFLFCAGDMAMIAYFRQADEILSFDDRNERQSYFFRVKSEGN
jgi:hypothetical protein